MLSLTDINLLKSIASEYELMCTQLGYEEIFLDKKLYLSIEKRKRSIEPLVTAFKEYLAIKEDIEIMQNILSQDNDSELKNEYEECKNKLQIIEIKLKELIGCRDSSVDSICLEIVPIVGERIVDTLIMGVTNYCSKHHIECLPEWKDSRKIFKISGLNVRNIFNVLSGLHIDDDRGKCQVFVYDYTSLPIISESDIIIETSRSSGAGGQHINTTDSSIRAIHKPTGLSVICQNERSQLQNKSKAIENLKEKVNRFFEHQLEEKILAERKNQLKNMKKAKRIYDFDNNQIVDGKDVVELKDFQNGEAL